MEIQLVLMLIGFSLAAYAIVANDAIQTLGTFLSSNAHRPWWVLWIFAMSILTATLVYGFYANGGDVSYARLEKFPPVENFNWIYLLPPLFILFLTRFGIPVSTTFLVLTVFTTTNLESMLTKSLLGYLVAFVVAIVLYRFVLATLEKYFIKSSDETTPAPYWTVLQWISTGFLWSQWLIQDLANIFVYAPSTGFNEEGVRIISSGWLWGAIVWFGILHAYLFYNRGGQIQKIVTSKTNTADIRSATIVDFIYGIILLVFKEMSNIPMSTTWVFLGLLAGREFAIAWVTQMRKQEDVLKIVLSDAGKAIIGLIVSVSLAFSAPYLKTLF
ncbi:MAG TPA: hypothetical protein ENK95_02955 [Campylobacterales bacterium]|nr:hypothetical protein [Campylobacterales bacterium]